MTVIKRNMGYKGYVRIKETCSMLWRYVYQRLKKHNLIPFAMT